MKISKQRETIVFLVRSLAVEIMVSCLPASYLLVERQFLLRGFTVEAVILIDVN